jgi:hypothetical protein
MRNAYSAWQSPRAGSVATLLIGAAVLSGCSGSLGNLSTDWFPSMPGFSSVQSGATDQTASTASASAAAPALSMDDDCPTVDIRTGASTLAIAAKVQQATANDLRYQLSFTQVARQCAKEGGSIRMRVGVQGRAIAGPAGAPSQIDVPIRYAVVREGVSPKTIVTKFRRVSVPFPPGAPHVQFTDIEDDLSFPIPDYSDLQAYVVYVGFDDVGDKPARPAPKKRGRGH